MLASTDRRPQATNLGQRFSGDKSARRLFLSLAESERYIAQFQGHFDAYSKAEDSRQKAEDHKCSFYHQDAKNGRAFGCG